jgi:hypothetical protein
MSAFAIADDYTVCQEFWIFTVGFWYGTRNVALNDIHDFYGRKEKLLARRNAKNVRSVRSVSITLPSRVFRPNHSAKVPSNLFRERSTTSAKGQSQEEVQ